jgi:general secretion pathway protein N
MDSLPVETRDDLFAAKPPSAPPAAVVRAPAPVERPLAAASAPPALSDNPLWAIPLSRLSSSRDRPLFAPSRRPAAPAPVAMSAPVQAAPPKPAEPEKPPLSLLGTIIGSEKIGLFMDSASKSVVRLKFGDNHKGWILRAVDRHQVELTKGLDIAVLDIPPPETKAGAAPAGPMLAGAPPVPLAQPVAMPAPPPGPPPSGANMNLPVNRAARGTVPGAQPANYKLQPPPGFTNPWANPGAR